MSVAETNWSSFSSTTGGVMTMEVGAITGELELLTRATPDGGIEAMVRYSGAQDLYTVSRSPVCAVSECPDLWQSSVPPTSVYWRR